MIFGKTKRKNIVAGFNPRKADYGFVAEARKGRVYVRRRVKRS